jgi:hypothetical protein
MTGLESVVVGVLTGKIAEEVAKVIAHLVIKSSWEEDRSRSIQFK